MFSLIPRDDEGVMCGGDVAISAKATMTMTTTGLMTTRDCLGESIMLIEDDDASGNKPVMMMDVDGDAEESPVRLLIPMPLALGGVVSPPCQCTDGIMRLVAPAPSHNMEKLIAELHQEFAAARGGPVNAERVRLLMARTDITEEDQRKYLKFDPSRYTRNLVYKTDEFALLFLCWHSGVESSIHAHGGSQCWMRHVQGELVETRYAYPTDEDERMSRPMIPLETTRMRFSPQVNERCVYIEDELGVHKVSNTGAMPAVTLHLYAPPIEEALCFDAATSRARRCRVTYDSELGVPSS